MLPASTASRSALMTLRNAPLWDGTVRLSELIWVRMKQKYFCKWRWTGQITLIRFSKSQTGRNAKALAQCLRKPCDASLSRKCCTSFVNSGDPSPPAFVPTKKPSTPEQTRSRGVWVPARVRYAHLAGSTRGLSPAHHVDRAVHDRLELLARHAGAGADRDRVDGRGGQLRQHRRIG
jgi:hypothetical protein